MFLFHRHHRQRSHLYLSLHLHGMWGVYLNEFFRRIATSLIGLFVPIYILDVTGDFIFVLWFFLSFAFFAAVSEYISALVIRRIGVDWGMVLGGVFRFGFIVLLIFAERNPIFFFFSAMSYGFSSPFDWLPFHYVVVKVSKKAHLYGMAASYSVIVTQFASAISPVIGGFVIYLYGYTALYSVAAALLILSVLMPFLDDFKKNGMHVSGKEMLDRFEDPGIWKHIFAFWTKGFDGFVYMMVWPIFLISLMGSVQSSGLLHTISLLVALFSTYYTGRFVDKKNFKMMKPGALLVSLSWWSRIFSLNGIHLFIVDLVYNIGLSFLRVKSHKKDTMTV